MKNTVNIKSKEHRMARIPSDELVSAASELSHKAYVLLMYYYSKGDTWEWVDKKIANDLKWSDRQIKQYRKELIDLDYLLVFRGQISNVFIGKQAVTNFKYNRKLENIDETD